MRDASRPDISSEFYLGAVVFLGAQILYGTEVALIAAACTVFLYVVIQMAIGAFR